MKYGLSEAIVAKIWGVFARYPTIEKVVLYGSRAQGNYKPGSDIDLTLNGKNLTISQLGDIAEEPDDLLLPYMFDLSIFDQLGNSDLRDHIERVGQVFYEKHFDKGKVGT